MLVVVRRMIVVSSVGALLILFLQFLLSRDQAPLVTTDMQVPTRQVTVYDVLAAKIPTPTLTRVRFPGWDYYRGENLEADITSYNQVPMLKDMDSMPAQWREHFPESLPPVAQRLPENPGVVRGCEAIGNYGGVWRICLANDWDISRKIGYESFIRFDPSGRIQPALAWKWEVADNNRVYTFHLRKGHRWSDGHPFTTKDLLWTFRDMYDWPFGSGRPEWMQETDGRTRLYEMDILDWDIFLERLLSEAGDKACVAGGEADGEASKAADAGSSLSIGSLLVEIGGKEIIDVVRDSLSESPCHQDKRPELLARINQAIRESDFYRAELFGDLDIQSEINELKALGESRLSKDQYIRLNNLREVSDIRRMANENIEMVQPISMTKLNLLMFRQLYSQSVAKGRLRSLKVEAVPDENGDDSHIIRFTFPRPNSIFLEKTGTFMFYLRHFDRPWHKNAPLHVAGSNILNTIDVLDWPQFILTLKNTPARPGAGPISRLLSMMSRDGLAVLDRLSANADCSQQDKQLLVDAINKALEDRLFYNDEDWDAVDLDSELLEIERQGWFAICQNRATMRYARDLAIRADLLKRLHEEGRNSLGPDEIYQMNLMLLRTAMQPVLALDRERALNAEAASHPEHYSSWGHRFRVLYRYHPEYNNDIPTLKPWRVVSDSRGQTMLALRNPYYYKVDPEGNQLPYISAIEITKESRVENLLLKLASGNVDFQVRTITFEHYSYLKSKEAEGKYEIRLWANDYCGEVTFAPLQSHKDPVYAALQDTPDFRHALSLAIDRQEIIDVVYKGIGEPAQYSAPVGSPYYNEMQAKMSVEFDPQRASELLDAIGLDKRRSDGIRLLPDGRPLILNVETEKERPLAVIQMVCKYWREIGIDTRMQIRSYAALNRMMQIGILDVRVHKEGGNFFGPLMGAGYAPTHEAEAVQWFNWASYIRTGGRRGWSPPERIMNIQRMWERVIYAPSDEEKFKAWHLLAEQTARDLPVIGIMTSPGKLVYVRNNFRNVPKISMAGWIAHDPGNCCPETFFFDDSLGSDDHGEARYR